MLDELLNNFSAVDVVVVDVDVDFIEVPDVVVVVDVVVDVMVDKLSVDFTEVLNVVVVDVDFGVKVVAESCLSFCGVVELSTDLGGLAVLLTFGAKGPLSIKIFE